MTIDFGVPEKDGSRVMSILNSQKIKFYYDGSSGGFIFFIFEKIKEYYKAVKLVEEHFIKDINSNDPDWIEWKTPGKGDKND